MLTSRSLLRPRKPECNPCVIKYNLNYPRHYISHLNPRQQPAELRAVQAAVNTPTFRARASASYRLKSTMAQQDSTVTNLAGFWQANKIEKLFYGSGSVQKHLLSTLPDSSSKAFIITGSSLANKTDLIKQVEKLLGSKHHAGTFSNIGQHAPIADLDKATALVTQDPSITTVISIGGGSPIDSAKVISHRVHEKTGSFLQHISIPTTLSAAECTMMAGYTSSDGIKTGVRDPSLAPQVVIYDATFGRETPAKLWLSTGLRALDHAVETMYHGSATEMPARTMALSAIGGLFEGLTKYKADPGDEDTITSLQLAAFASLGFLGQNMAGGLGLSHALGYALGSPYSIPHGVTSCLTLGHVVKLKAEESPGNAAQLARVLPVIGVQRSGDDVADAKRVGDEILKLVERLGLKTSLKEYNVGEDQVPVIVKRATKAEEGELYEKVAALVKTLY